MCFKNWLSFIFYILNIIKHLDFQKIYNGNQYYFQVLYYMLKVKPHTLLYILISLNLSLHCSVGYIYAAEKELLETRLISESLKEYERKLNDLGQTLPELKIKQDWINLKIDQMKAYRKEIPIEIKSQKSRLQIQIEATKKEINSLKQIVNKYHKRLHALKPKNSPQKVSEDYVKGNANSQTILKEAIEHQIDKENILKDWVSLSEQGHEIILKVVLPVIYAKGKIELSKDYIDFFDKLTDILLPYPFSIYIKGFSEPNDCLLSNYKNTKEIASLRALNIKKIFIKKGYPASNVETSTGNTDIDKLHTNRRVEVTGSLLILD